MRVRRLWQAKEEERIKVATKVGNLSNRWGWEIMVATNVGDLSKRWGWGKGGAGERVGLGEDQGGLLSVGWKSRALSKWKPMI